MRTKILLLSLSLMVVPLTGLADDFLSKTVQAVETTKVLNAQQREVEVKAVQRIQHLISKKIIDESWHSEAVLKSMQSEKKMHYGEEVWVVHFKNKNRYKNPANKVLYVFFKLSGDYLIANFSGK